MDISIKKLFPEEYQKFQKMCRDRFRMHENARKPATEEEKVFLCYKYSKRLNKNIINKVICPSCSCHIRADDRKSEPKQLTLKKFFK